ncbi:MAG: SBBP repeat-containing protein, partial [bacterium]
MHNHKIGSVFLLMLICLSCLSYSSSLIYSTFLGGSEVDVGNDITIDTSGNTYIIGYTSSTDFPTSINAIETSYRGGTYDVLISKLSEDGSTLLYSTFLGGSGSDWGTAIELDTLGNVVITGYTESANYPVTANALSTTNHGQNDSFISKLSSDGSSLIYSTYLGGSSIDISNDLALDTAGNIYITGKTTSSDFPVTPGAIDTTYSDTIPLYDVFVSKLSADGSSLLYSTYLGGPSYIFGDYGNAITVDNDGKAYIVGRTDSSKFPTTPGAFDTTYNGSNDVYVSKINNTGTALIFSTFLGGSGSDSGEDIKLDKSGNIYIVGYTSATNFPTTPGAWDTTYNGGIFDCFISKLNATGSVLLYSTYFGGSDRDQDIHLAIDNQNCVYIAGYTASSTDFPITT